MSCRPNETVTRIPADHARLRGIATIYAYAAADLGRPPRSVDELLPIFEKASITDPDQTLTSTRDGQPFVIVWGVDVAGVYAGSAAPLAYERLGVDGRRLAITCGLRIKEVNESEFAVLSWPYGYQPEE
ncbi:hypothetical protein [Botrimarina hoheduenensis]|uniref:hypothetical protein n=1 Tax=Botrimarina hoheduenensis TaxID=2528000 RepID=UPI0018D411E7|nr:hypothetical protein [Botrimarina hoheduenensis]